MFTPSTLSGGTGSNSNGSRERWAKRSHEEKLKEVGLEVIDNVILPDRANFVATTLVEPAEQRAQKPRSQSDRFLLDQ